MATTLTIDRGNGSAKIAVWEGERLLHHLTTPELDDGQLDDVVASLRPSGCIYSTVCDDAEQIAGRLAALGVRSVRLTPQLRLPIALDYATPHTLGSDRIAAAVGAYTSNPGHGVLVVDIGTAVTYDLVDAQGHFVGGNIAPGIGMRLKALARFTAKLPHVDSRGPAPLFGHDTTTAMRSGAVRGVVGEMAYYRSHLPEDTRVVLTGGWANDVAALTDLPTEVDRHLVNRGLNRIYLYNETT